MTTPPLMTVTQVAALLNVRRKTVYAWIRAGQLRAARLPGGTDLRLRRTDVDAFVADLFEPTDTPVAPAKVPPRPASRTPDLFALGRSRAGQKINQ